MVGKRLCIIGDLSKRVHLLKCEEGGYDFMYGISKELYNQVIEIRKIEVKKETALKMKKKGYSEIVIVYLLGVGVNIVQKWLSGVEAVRK